MAHVNHVIKNDAAIITKVEVKLMGVIQRINDFLNYKIELDMNKRINRNKSLLFVGLLTVLLAAVGYYIGDRWFWLNNPNYYEYEIKNLQDNLKQNPDSVSIKTQIAMTSYLNGNSDKAISILRDVLKNDPQNDGASLDLGLILSEQKQYNESTPLLLKYIAKKQGLETRLAYLYLGRNYLSVGKYKEAVNYLNEAKKRDEGNPVVYYYLGQSYEKVSDKKSAIKSYEKALELNSNYTEAGKALDNLIKKGTK